MLKFCGIDPSLSSTGVCITNNEESDYLESFAIKSTKRGEARLIEIRNKVTSILVEHKPNYIFYEGYAFGARGRVFDLGELGGVLKVKLFEEEYKFFIVPPTVLKKFIIGKGIAPKDLMREYVYRAYGKGSEVLKTTDEVDAFALCQFGIAIEVRLNNKKLDLAKNKIQALDKYIKDMGLDSSLF